MTIQKIKSGRITSVTADEYVGEHGTIFYNEELGDLRLSDGNTLGGVSLSSGSGAGIPGPAGPQGPVGETGPQGPQGPQGTAGNATLLEQITNVDASNLSNNSVLVYQLGVSKWLATTDLPPQNMDGGYY